jgi:hypothetical protein
LITAVCWRMTAPATAPSGPNTTAPDKAPSLIRKRAQVLGFVDAPDQVSAEVAAVKAFNLDDEQRHRLLVQERG